jgi:preprotein translocase subunit YajC
MENELFQLATSQGIWAVLSVFLIFYILKAQEKREDKYQKIIFELTEELKIISEINDHVKNIIPRD